MQSNSADNGEDVARIFIEFPLWTGLGRALIEFMLIRVTPEFSARDNDRYSHAEHLFSRGSVGPLFIFPAGLAFHLFIIKRNTRAKLSRVFSARRNASRPGKILRNVGLYTVGGFPKWCVPRSRSALGIFKRGAFARGKMIPRIIWEIYFPPLVYARVPGVLSI